MIITCDTVWLTKVERLCGVAVAEWDRRQDFVTATEAVMAGAEYDAYVVDMGTDRQASLVFVRLLRELKDRPYVYLVGHGEEDGRDARIEGATVFLEKGVEEERLALLLAGKELANPPLLS